MGDADTPVNGLAIKEKFAAGAEAAAAAAQRGLSNGRFDEPIWAFVFTMLPFIVDLLLRGSISGWKESAVDVQNLAFCLFAVSVAVFVRVASHGQGRNILSFMLLFAILQAGYALHFSGTFDKDRLESSRLVDQVGIIQQVSDREGDDAVMSKGQLREVRDILEVLQRNDHQPSPTVYLLLGISGAASTVALFLLWSPIPVPTTSAQARPEGVNS